MQFEQIKAKYTKRHCTPMEIVNEQYLYLVNPKITNL